VSTSPRACAAPMRRARIRPTRCCARTMRTGVDSCATYSSSGSPRKAATTGSPPVCFICHTHSCYCSHRLE
jgi:hypothetical protein